MINHATTQEKERLYVELKGILARQPGPEVAEQLSIYQVCMRTAVTPHAHVRESGAANAHTQCER